MSKLQKDNVDNDSALSKLSSTVYYNAITYIYFLGDGKSYAFETR